MCLIKFSFRYESLGSSDCCIYHFDHHRPLLPEKDLDSSQKPASEWFSQQEWYQVAANWKGLRFENRKKWQFEKRCKRFEAWKTCTNVLPTDFFAERGATCSQYQNENDGRCCQACSQMNETTRVDQKPRKWSVNPQYKLVPPNFPLSTKSDKQWAGGIVWYCIPHFLPSFGCGLGPLCVTYA